MTTEDKNLTLNDKPTICLSGLLGRKVTSRMVTTKDGPKMAVDFQILVDFGKDDKGNWLPGKYIRCTAWGNYAGILESFASQPRARVAVSGRYNARPEKVGNDGKVYPPRLEFTCTNVFTVLDPEASLSAAIESHKDEALPF